MAFVTSRHLRARIEPGSTMVHADEKCICAEDNIDFSHSGHRAARDAGYSSSLVAELSWVASSCLLASRGLTTQRFGSATWPACIEDLLPYGPKASLDGLVYCFNITPSTSITGLFIGVFSYARYELMPLLLDDELRRSFVMTFCRHLHDAAAAHRASLRGEVWSGHADEQPVLRLINVALLIQLIESGPGSDPSSWTRLVRGMEMSVIVALEDARWALKPHDFCDVLALLAVRVYQSQGTALAALPVALRKYALHFDNLNNDPYYRLFNQVVGVNKNVGCCMPGCGKHPHELDPGTKLQRCRECKFVQYCSRECQKQHWKLDSYPHKAVCARMRNLFEVAPFEYVGQEGYGPFVLGCKAALTPVEAEKLASELGPYVQN